MDDGHKVSWPTGIREKKALLLCSDATANTLKAAASSKVFHHSLIHFTFIAHWLKGDAEKVRVKLPQVKTFISVRNKTVSESPAFGANLWAAVARPCLPNRCQSASAVKPLKLRNQLQPGFHLSLAFRWENRRVHSAIKKRPLKLPTSETILVNFRDV